MFTSSVAIIYIEGQKFLEHWKEKAEREVPDERTLTERIESYYYDKSNAMRDFKRLAQFSEDEFYNWFRTTTNPKVISMATALSHIQYGLPSAITEIRTIEENVLAALRCISGENKISEIRLRSVLAKEVKGRGPKIPNLPPAPA